MLRKSWKTHKSSLVKLTEISKPNSLAEGAYSALIACDLDEKVRLTNDTATAWENRKLSLLGSKRLTAPARPGRPEKPI